MGNLGNGSSCRDENNNQKIGGCPYSGWDFVNGDNNPTDDNGHGTHIAGIIGNADKGSDKEWNGIAPGVNLVGVRVLDETGTGSYESVIQGIQWVIAHKDKYNNPCKITFKAKKKDHPYRQYCENNQDQLHKRQFAKVSS